MQPCEQLDYMRRFMHQVLTQIGPRQSCGRGERRLAQRLLEELRPNCDHVWQESFTCHPRAFLGAIRLSVGCHFVGVLFYCWDLPWLALLFGTSSILATALELGSYHEFVDPLFPRRRSQNVVATIAPQGEVRQRIVVSAHLDSAFEFTLWRLLGDRSVWVLGLAVVGGALVPIASATEIIARPLGWQMEFATDAFGLALLALTPFVGACYFFHSGRAVPGAMDDLAGVSILAALSRELGKKRGGAANLPRHTELVLLATGCEEAGLRGAKRFVRRHSEELRRIPTYGVFLDGICDERQIAAVRREYCTGVRFDEHLRALARESGAHRGWRVNTVDIPLGGTDAAAFSKAGVAAFTLVGMPCDTLIENYHTRLDTLDRIRPHALTRTLRIAADLVARLDRDCCGTAAAALDSGDIRVGAEHLRDAA